MKKMRTTTVAMPRPKAMLDDVMRGCRNGNCKDWQRSRRRKAYPEESEGMSSLMAQSDRFGWT